MIACFSGYEVDWRPIRVLAYPRATINQVMDFVLLDGQRWGQTKTPLVRKGMPAFVLCLLANTPTDSKSQRFDIKNLLHLAVKSLDIFSV